MEAGSRTETHHGTRSGQLLLPEELVDLFGLTPREAECSTLLAVGASRADIAKRLGISPSTAAKHLATLRQKLGVRSNAEVTALVLREAAGAEAAPQHSTSTRLPVSWTGFSDEDRALADSAAAAVTLPRILELLVDHLRPRHVGAVIYCFLPLGIASFRDGDFLECAIAPDAIVDAHHASGGVAANPVAQAIFLDPERAVVIDGEDPEFVSAEHPLRISDPLLEACLSSGFRFGLSLGSPFGGGFVGASFFFSGDAGIDDETRAAPVIEATRNALLVAHNAAFAFGGLAATCKLSVRERDALSQLAQGATAAEAASALGISGRALTKLIGNARQKVGAKTTHQAICKASALNALVFQ